MGRNTRPATPHERIDDVLRMITNMRREIGVEVTPLYDRIRKVEEFVAKSSVPVQQELKLDSLAAVFDYVHAVEERFEKMIESQDRQIKCLFARTNGEPKAPRGATMSEINALIDSYSIGSASSLTATGKAILATAIELKARRLRDQTAKE